MGARGCCEKRDLTDIAQIPESLLENFSNRLLLCTLRAKKESEVLPARNFDLIHSRLAARFLTAFIPV